MSTKSVTVLIVEDDDDLRRSIAIALDTAGMSSVEADDAESALETLETHEFELAVVDLALPTINGYELARELRRRRPAMALVAVSGKQHLMDVIENSFDAAMTKPFQMERLVKTCNGMRKRSRKLKAHHDSDSDVDAKPAAAEDTPPPPPIS